VAKEKPFKTEVELCRHFLSDIGKGWMPYAETAGHDILLVRSDGFQIGVQAKLRLGTDVINQTLEEGRYSPTRPGPDCRAVLVPFNEEHGFTRIAAYIGFTIIQVYAPKGAEIDFGYRPSWSSRDPKFTPRLPDETHRWANDSWHELCPVKRHALPEYVPDVDAGASSPVQLTDWKISAIKIAVTLEIRGFVTRADFKHVGIDHRRWLAAGNDWLIMKDGRWVAGPGIPDFKAQHPRVYGEITADQEKWMRRALDV
jgi:hypothetical protein